MSTLTGNGCQLAHGHGTRHAASRSNPRYVVLAGLPATGKTTLARKMATDAGWRMVPEHKEWITARTSFPATPRNFEEKLAKQEFFFKVDKERYRWVVEQLANGHRVVSDTDFTSPLAHNYAERRLSGAFDVSEWLIETYIGALARGDLGFAELYIFLDVSMDVRRSRRETDFGRKRNNIFFEEPFAKDMREFYWLLMNPASLERICPAAWVDYSVGQGDALERVTNAIHTLPPSPGLRLSVSTFHRALRRIFAPTKK